MTLEVETAVIGSGPVALAHALFTARLRPVVLCGRRTLVTPAVERVPAPLLTLLLELGVTPPEVDVNHLTTERVVAWDQEQRDVRQGPACAHLDRAALVDALWRRVDSCPDVHVVPPPSRLAALTGNGWMAKQLVDATGRRAVTAGGHIRPTPVWVATCCTVERQDCDPTMMLAGAATGYAYRLGSARWLTLGWVGPGPPPRGPSDLSRRLEDEGAGWLAAPTVDGHWGRRVASLDIPVNVVSAGAVAIGDAALARDALASQGTAIGLSDACLAAGPARSGDLEHRRRDGLARHLRSLTEALDTCHHRDRPAWSGYRRWLAQQLTVAAPVTR